MSHPIAAVVPAVASVATPTLAPAAVLIVLGPAATWDHGLVLAAASSYLDRPLRGDLVVLGEVGLAGEVRAVTGLETRLKEAAALGFTAAVVPQSTLASLTGQPLDVQGVGTVDEAVKVLLGP